MKKSLVIVESPSKAKTINKFLGNNFIVKASVGHIKDLPEKELGINVEKGFTPKYISIPKQRKTINDLKKEAAKSSSIYIATDPDREGEAIAWHISEVITGSNAKIYRALFNEISENSVLNAINNPLTIDDKKVDAQQARRVLDRLVGYKVSPLLWKTLYKGSLSAGRVQSVALKLICEREQEHKAFKPEEYWTINVLLDAGSKDVLEAKLTKCKNEKITIPDKQTADDTVAGFKDSVFILKSIDKKKVKRNPQPPFITSTLQQDASNKLGFPPAKTMFIAQQLYEGIELGNEGSISLITYMRTDSTRISNDALKSLRTYIEEKYGRDFLPAKPRVFKSKKKSKIQDAHECIRPVYLDKSPDNVQGSLNRDQFRLYNLIWNRVMASQMESAVFNQTSIKIEAGDYQFNAAGSEQLFPGFLKVWEDGEIEDNGNGEEFTKIPPGLKIDMELFLKDIMPNQHFTKPAPRFTDSSLVKELDNLGIGRPSTYAQIIYTLVSRKYILREKKTLFPTELGEVVNKIVISQFPDIFNVDFTANMENELDQIEAGSKRYLDVVRDFYKPFNNRLEQALLESKEIKKAIQEKAGTKCDKCGSDMVIKWSKTGKFQACSAFPKCKNTISTEENNTKPESAGFECDKCGSEMVVRKGKYGKFYACSAYPKCKNVVNLNKEKSTKPEPAGFKCDKCGSEMVVRSSKRGKFYGCSAYPKCKNLKPINNKSKKTD
ncbi:type I DNA topoisomerase [candidate division KSB1 bacterium]